MNSSSSKGYIVLDYFDTFQSTIIEALEKYPRVRDFTNKTPLVMASVNICLLVASAMNLTLITSSQVIELSLHSKYPVIFPYVSTGGGGNRSEMKLYQKYKNLYPQEGMVLRSQRKTAYNFAYCNSPTHIQEQASIAAIAFLKTADIQVWLCLSASIFLITCIGNAKMWLRKMRNGGSPLLVTMSALLTSGLSGESRWSKYSPLIILWMLGCEIFDNFYEGSLTSVLISPEPEAGLSRMIHLVEQQFKLIYKSKLRRNIMLDIVQDNLRNLVQAKNYSWERIPLTGESPEDLYKFEYLLQQSYVVTSAEFDSKLAGGTGDKGKYATITDWGVAIHTANHAQAYIKSLNIEEQPSRKKNLHKCYIGKELSFPKQMYYGFGPPRSSEVAGKFQIFVEAGVVDLWVNEFTGLATSLRVQERSRLISPTQLVEDRMDPSPLRIWGRLKYSFILWAICLIGCFIDFLFEILKFTFIRLLSLEYKRLLS